MVTLQRKKTPVICAINYKGGVGKSTIVANVGACLAAKGMRVLLIDIDPQASLSFMFVPPAELFGSKQSSILTWYAAFEGGVPGSALAGCLLTPVAANAALAGRGQIDLIVSDLNLLDFEQRITENLLRSDDSHRSNQFHARTALAEALAGRDFTSYDAIFIDCPPNLGFAAKAALTASSHVLIPARPDQLSSYGVDLILGAITELVQQHNDFGARYLHGSAFSTIAPELIGVVFNMVTNFAGKPITVQQAQMQRLRALNVRILNASLRHMPSAYANIDLPLPLQLAVQGNIAVQEIFNLTAEIQTITGIPDNSNRDLDEGGG